jgi:MoaA/NifB/PqqE/SkfB family radical SAM enzyme
MSIAAKLRMGLSLLASRVTGKPVPVLVNWAITGRCNLRCRHCYGAYGVSQKTELPTETVFRLLSEMRRAGTLRVNLEGGEPLCRKDIHEIVDRIRELGMEASLCTNGVGLEQHLDAFRGKLDVIVLSLDGAEKAHDFLRGKGNFRKVLAAIDAARAAGFRVLLFNTLMDHNLDDVDEVIRIAEAQGTHVTFNIAVAVLGKGRRVRIPKKDETAYRRALSHIVESKRAGAPVYYSERNFRQALAWPSYDRETLSAREIESLPAKVRSTLVPCEAGRHWCYVECDGRVYPCYQQVGTLAVKNAVDVGFRAAFDHLATLDLCRACYNLTISELNLQARLDARSVARVFSNYLAPRRRDGRTGHA